MSSSSSTNSSDEAISLSIDCPVCMQPLLDPRSMHCGHTICHQCLTTLVDGAIMHVLPFIRCPVCRSDHDRLRAGSIGKNVHFAEYVAGEVKRRNEVEEEETEVERQPCDKCKTCHPSCNLLVCVACPSNDRRCVKCYARSTGAHKVDHAFVTADRYDKQVAIWDSFVSGKLKLPYEKALAMQKEMVQELDKLGEFDIGLTTHVNKCRSLTASAAEQLEGFDNVMQRTHFSKSAKFTDAKAAMKGYTEKLAELVTVMKDKHLPRVRSLVAFNASRVREMEEFSASMTMGEHHWATPPNKRVRVGDRSMPIPRRRTFDPFGLRR